MDHVRSKLGLGIFDPSKSWMLVFEKLINLIIVEKTKVCFVGRSLSWLMEYSVNKRSSVLRKEMGLICFFFVCVCAYGV